MSHANAGATDPVRRMRRAQRREQILDAATRAFARGRYSATSLDDVAGEAGITRVLLYRHFDSKNALYRAVLDRAGARLDEAIGGQQYDNTTIPALVRSAAADPDGFRLLFQYAAREPEFRDLVDSLTSTSVELAHRSLAERLGPGPWVDWAARLLPTLTQDAVIAWLDAGQPDPDRAAERVTEVVRGVLAAVQR